MPGNCLSKKRYAKPGNPPFRLSAIYKLFLKTSNVYNYFNLNRHGDGQDLNEHMLKIILDNLQTVI